MINHVGKLLLVSPFHEGPYLNTVIIIMGVWTAAPVVPSRQRQQQQHYTPVVNMLAYASLAALLLLTGAPMSAQAAVAGYNSNTMSTDDNYTTTLFARADTNAATIALSASLSEPSLVAAATVAPGLLAKCVNTCPAINPYSAPYNAYPNVDWSDWYVLVRATVLRWGFF